MTDIWFVRAGRDSIYADDFIQGKVVGIGWDELGQIEPTATKAELLERYKQANPDHGEGKAQNAVSQIVRFIQEIRVGDEIMTFDRDKQMYYMGKVTSECKWKPELMVDLPRVREVDWQFQVPRAALSTNAKNVLGAIQTLFLVRGKVASELRSKASGLRQIPEKSVAPVQVSAEGATKQQRLESEVRAELLEKAEQAIEDRILRLEWEQVQELVAGILRAMGYRTTVSPRGSDRGVDVFASRDGLGLEEPRIFVEVKHRPATAIGAEGVRAFLGGRSSGDRCLYVSTGGFTKEARYEADRANKATTLIGLVDLRRLYVEYYDKLDEEVKSLIPLKRVYVLAE